MNWFGRLLVNLLPSSPVRLKRVASMSADRLTESHGLVFLPLQHVNQQSSSVSVSILLLLEESTAELPPFLSLPPSLPPLSLFPFWTSPLGLLQKERAGREMRRVPIRREPTESVSDENSSFQNPAMPLLRSNAVGRPEFTHRLYLW